MVALSRRVWTKPVALAAITSFGLLDALLLETDAARCLAWLALLLPLAVSGWCLRHAFIAKASVSS
jgi:hypothetical protein